jgi:hypothetical protein
VKLVSPEHWYILFWTLGTLIAFSPLYVLLYLILQELRRR